MAEAKWICEINGQTLIGLSVKDVLEKTIVYAISENLFEETSVNTASYIIKINKPQKA
jgi:hypothetical protein